MVLVVEDVHQIGVEGMHVVQLGEVLDDLRETVVHVLLRVLDLPGVEGTDAGDFVAFVHDRGRLPLGLR